MKKLEVRPYNDKSFVVVGSETKRLSQQLKSLGGRFCFLPASDPAHAGYYEPAWVYAVSKYNLVVEQLEALLAKSKPAKKEANTQPAKAPAATSKPAAKKEPVKKEPVKKELAKPPVRIKPIEF